MPPCKLSPRALKRILPLFLALFLLLVAAGPAPIPSSAPVGAAATAPVLDNLSFIHGSGYCNLQVEIKDTAGYTIKNRGIKLRVVGTSTWTAKANRNNTDNPYKVTISGLMPRTRYEVMGYVLYIGPNENQTEAYSPSITYTSLGPPLVDSLAVVSTTQTTATFSARIVDDGGVPPIKARRFYFKTADGSPLGAVYDFVNKIGTYELTAKTLDPNTEYRVLAEVENGFGSMQTLSIPFRTKPLVPVVSTKAYPILVTTDEDSFTATLRGSVDLDNGGTVTERGFVYGFSSQPTLLNSMKTTSGTGLGSYSKSVPGLVRGVLYYYRAYARNSGGTGYGEIRTFMSHLPGATPTPTPVASPTPIPSHTPAPTPTDPPTPTQTPPTSTPRPTDPNPTAPPDATPTAPVSGSPTPGDPTGTEATMTPAEATPTPSTEDPTGSEATAAPTDTDPTPPPEEPTGTNPTGTPTAPTDPQSATGGPTPTKAVPAGGSTGGFPWIAIPIVLVLMGFGLAGFLWGRKRKGPPPAG